MKAADIALDKKALDPVVLEVKDLSSIADYFLVCSGENPVQIKAIAEAIDEFFSRNKIRPIGKEGFEFAKWILMDYGDLVINIFNKELREYYGLEKLWLDAPRIPVGEISLQSR